MDRRKTFFVRSVWVMLSIFLVLLTLFVAVGTVILKENSAIINARLNIETYKKFSLKPTATKTWSTSSPIMSSTMPTVR